ncbi:MAG: GNAT family N-acetyltransferase [Rhizomicrobium sp.]
MIADALQWHDKPFAELTVTELYAICALRQRVFIVEQSCAYLDADGVDLVSRHLWAETGGVIHAYLRIVPAGAKHHTVSLGRVITAPEARGKGLGRVLVQRGIDAVGAVAITIGAQAHLEKFYAELGFVRSSDVYDEDGIPHIEMTRAT